MKHPIPRSVLIAALLALAGCQTAPPAASSPPAEAVALPDPAPELAGLEFMAGAWAAVNPNRTVNREHWMSPRGRTMAGAFQQMRPDGTPAFYELSAIVAESDGVRLYHRHLHRALELDQRRMDVDVFRLRAVEIVDGQPRAVFEPQSGPAAAPGGIQTVTYRADGPDRLVQELAFKPDSKEKDFSTVYVRER